MRPPSRRLAPQGQNRQAAPPRPSGGGVRGPGPPLLSSLPPPRPRSGQRPAGETAAPHPQARGGNNAAAASAAARKAPQVDRAHAPALPATDRQRNGGTQEGAGGATHSEAGPGKAGAWTRARRSLPPLPPPPCRTDPLAADRAAPDAHGRPATPTARVCPGGARRRQRMTGAGDTGHPTGQGGGEQQGGPPSPLSPPTSPPACQLHAPALRPPGAQGTSPLPQKGARHQGGGRSRTRTPRAPAPHTACSRGGRGRRASPRQRAKATHGPRLGVARDDEPEQYRGRAPNDQNIASDTRNVALGECRGGGSVCRSPRGSGSQAAPPPPPPEPGGPHPVHGAAPRPQPNANPGGGNAPATRGGQGREPQAPPQREGRGAAARPPPRAPHRPASRGGSSPHPPEAEGKSPLPPAGPQRPRGGPEQAPPPRPSCLHPQEPRRTSGGRQHARAPHRPRPETASEHEPERYGGHALHDQNDASDTRIVGCSGEAEGRNEAGRPPAQLAPLAAQTGARRSPPPHPIPPPGTGTPRTRRPTRRGAHNPEPGRGETGPGRPPPQARQTEQGTGAGWAEGHGPCGTALPAPSARTARGARATPTGGEEGGRGRRGSASAHTHKEHAGNTRRATGPSSRNAQTAWNGVPAGEG